jgi:shikimate dehydrogenase
MKINGKTKIVGVFGAPVSHTASPAMHNAAFAALKLDWVYLPFHVEPDQLKSALRGISALHLVGVNLTVPHKVAALDLVDEVDSEARLLGAINTIVVRDGRLVGYNTDGYGFAKAIEEEFGFTLEGKRVLVLGAGGAGRAIAVKCVLDNAQRVLVANRTPGKVEAIVKSLPANQAQVLSAIPLTTESLRNIIGDVDLVVNATSVGLQPGDSLELEPSLFSPHLCVYDTIYRPSQTEFLKEAYAGGAKCANGLSMLLHQGARAFEIWTGEAMAPLAKMREALRTAVYGKKK